MIKLILEAGVLISCSITHMDGTISPGYAALQRYEFFNDRGNRVVYSVNCIPNNYLVPGRINKDELNERQLNQLNRILEDK